MSGWLIVLDDEPGIANLIREVASQMGFEATAVENANEFRRLISACEPRVVILDLVMPETDGVEILRFLAEKSCQAAIVLMTGADMRILTTARRLGAGHGLNILGTLHKPFKIDALRSVLASATKHDDLLSEKELHEALETRQLVVYYQPKAKLSNDGSLRIVAAEALVRWRHSRLGLVLPSAFIPLAEQTGLISPLTKYVLQTAIAQVARWQAEGLMLTVAVNLAPQLLTDLKIPDRITEILGEYSVEPNRLVLEITESGTTGETTTTMDILSRLRLKGIGLSIDDFGTGYSSLAQLHRMPFNELKIDRSFVTEISAGTEAEKIIHSIADLARNLGLNLCAEGVETPVELEFLRSVGCDTFQGFLVSPAVPAEEFTALAT